ncbi:MAG: universal stress protein [Actinobacteria bacterium]|nr:universal stress protein [Actinomycetota bacterium]
MDRSRRPTPEEILAKIEKDEQGGKGARLKLYIGAAAGVGKTYAMLEEAQRLKKRGVDVVVGFVETHGRSETEEKLAGLEAVPRKKVEYRGVVFEEMDGDAVITRKPTVALVDELAHTNVPGLKHAKRFQDVQDILESGVNVISTINIQHLESLNDVIAELTGVRVRETIPDKILERADEVVLVDISPEALRQRIQEGRVYVPQKIQQALNNFFRTENLAALREIVLRQVADEIEVKLEDVQRREGVPAVAERVMACVTTQPESQRILRRAWRMAKRLHGDLYVLHVQTDEERKLSEDEKRNLDSLKRLTGTLGGHWLTIVGDDVARVIASQATQQHITNVVVGEPRERAAVLGAFRPSFIMQVLEMLSGIDLHVVTREKRREAR